MSLIMMLVFLTSMPATSVTSASDAYVRFVHHRHAPSPIDLQVGNMTSMITFKEQQIEEIFASDINGNVPRYYNYVFRKGTANLFVQSIGEAHVPVNLWVKLAEDPDWVEVVLHFNKDPNKLHRRIFIQVPTEAGLTRGQPARPVDPPPPTKAEPQPDVRLLGQGKTRKVGPFGRLTYRFTGDAWFVHFKPGENIPAIDVLEVVTGHWWNPRKRQVVIEPTERLVLADGSVVLVFQKFATPRKMRKYLRIKFQGERNATYKKLR